MSKGPVGDMRLVVRSTYSVPKTGVPKLSLMFIIILFGKPEKTLRLALLVLTHDLTLENTDGPDS